MADIIKTNLIKALQLNSKSIAQILKHSVIFKNMAEDILNETSKEFEVVTYNKNDIVDYTQTDKYFFIVASGSFKMIRMDINSGKIIALSIYERYDAFDMLPMLDGKEHDVEFLATQQSVVLRISMKRMREWIGTYPELNKAFLPYFAQKMRRLEDFSEEIAFCDTKTRLAQLILRHVDDSCSLNNQPIPVKLINHLTHESIAELIGSVRSVVTTELNKLKQEGIIIGYKDSLAIKDLEKLKKKCHCLK